MATAVASRQLQKPFFTKIEFSHMHFLIMDSPNSSNVQNFVRDCQEQNVSDIVRLCEPRYPKEPFEAVGITVHELEFDDGSPPPEAVLEHWMDLLQTRFSVNFTANSSRENTKPVAVHCVAGYGRAPVLVAVALIELGMKSTDAIELIRQRRKGAFNDRQLHYLTHYKATHRFRRHNKQHSCSIS